MTTPLSRPADDSGRQSKIDRGSDAKLLRNVNLIDGTGGPVRTKTSILLRSGMIVGIGEDAENGIYADTEVSDLGGRAVLPGFFDCHVHMAFGPERGVLGSTAVDPVLSVLASTERMRATLDAGITSVRDLCGLPAGFRSAVQSGVVPGPRMQVALKALSHTGGHGDGHACGVNLTAFMSDLVDSVHETRVATRRLIRDGADVIKVCASGGMSSAFDDPDDEGLTEEEMTAVVDEVRRHRGIPVAAHAQGVRGIMAALRAGVSSIEHGYAISDEGCDLALENGTILVPTLRTALRTPTSGTISEAKYRKKMEWIDIARENIARAISRGVRIALGTDAGICTHGENLEELSLLVELGMNPMDAIVAGTATSAELLGVSHHLGALEVGKTADLIVVEGDPIQNISLLAERRHVQAVMVEGRWHRMDVPFAGT